MHIMLKFLVLHTSFYQGMLCARSMNLFGAGPTK